MTGIYDGDRYEVTEFRGDDGKPAWHVQREGGGVYQVRLKPPDCDCGAMSWQRGNPMASTFPIPCKHIRATRHIVQPEKR